MDNLEQNQTNLYVFLLYIFQFICAADIRATYSYEEIFLAAPPCVGWMAERKSFAVTGDGGRADSHAMTLTVRQPVEDNPNGVSIRNGRLTRNAE